MQFGGLIISVLLKPELLSTLQRRNFFLKEIILGALKRSTFSSFVKGYKMSFGSCERLHNVYTVWMAAEKEVRRLHWERESCWEEEFFLGTFGRLWSFGKTDVKLFLSIGGKSPVFPVACGVGHCFISCEGLATTRSGYPTVGGGEEQKSSF